MRPILLPLFLILIRMNPVSATEAKHHFTYTDEAVEAYDLILSLRFKEADQAIQQLESADPSNLVVHHLANYLDIFALFISEDKALFRDRKGKKEERLRLLQQGDPNSPWYLYVQADVRLQWALMRLRFGELLGAFNDISKAYQLLERNQHQYPDFMPNYKDLGMLHAVVGTVPDQYQWGVRLLSGLDGSIARGERELKSVLDYGRKHPEFHFTQETAVLYAYVQLHLLRKGEGAWQTVRAADLEPQKSLLHCFIMANIAMRTDRNEQALGILTNRPAGPEYATFPYLHFMEGMVRLRKLEEGAGTYFNTYVQLFKGSNFVKEAYQKMAWASLLEGNQEGYRRMMQECLQYGEAESGPDKNAMLEAQSNRIPPLPLLKARLLFDGGYHQRAYEVLEVHSGSDFSDTYHQLEFQYRMGRVFHGLEKYQPALLYYEKTIQAGKDLPYFFACNAALQKGLIYEEQGLINPAREAFEQCLSLNPDEYRTGLHHSAKAGLGRLEASSDKG